MNQKHRKILLIGLIIALFAGGFLGWLKGADMHSGIKSKSALLKANKDIREIEYALKAGALKKEYKNADHAVKAAVSRGAHSDDIRSLKVELRGAKRRLDQAPVKLTRLKEAKKKAELKYNEDSGWHSLYKVLNFSGKLFLNLLKLLVIPLVISSLIMGLSSLGNIRHVGRTGLRTIIYYFTTTGIAVAIGIALVQIISPGVGVEGAIEVAGKVHGKEDLGILETILRVFVDPSNSAKGAVPANIFKAMAEMNVLGVIVFTLLFGSALTMIGEKAKPVFAFFDGVNEAILRIIHWVFYLLPFGVFGLVVGRLAETGGGAAVFTELTRLGLYAFTVIGGLLIHAVIVLPLILWLVARRNPLKYLSGMAQALFTAFSTASSSATLPTTMECAEENNRISSRSASFVLPIGATINMDGTALYEAVAVIFIAQVYGVKMGAAMLLIVFLTATLAAIGAAGIPEAGLVTMVIVLNATGLPLEGIAVLLSIDWFLDRCRTTVNVWGDSVGAAVIDRFEERDNHAHMT